MQPASGLEKGSIVFGWEADATQKLPISLAMPKNMGPENATDLITKAASKFAAMALTTATEMADHNHGWF